MSVDTSRCRRVSSGMTDRVDPRTVLVALLLVFISRVPARAAADPDWLRMWNAAQALRPAEIGPVGRIAPANEPGTPLVVHGRVFEPDGMTPAAGVIVFAYHTDRKGLYFAPGARRSIWRLHGWAKTDNEGRFELRTIRPGAYPGRHVPAHIHFSFETAHHGRQWSTSLRFADDPLLSEKEKSESAAAGRFGNICVVELKDGVEHVRYFVRLKRESDF